LKSDKSGSQSFRFIIEFSDFSDPLFALFRDFFAFGFDFLFELVFHFDSGFSEIDVILEFMDSLLIFE
jgi:hypothetical protein